MRFLVHKRRSAPAVIIVALVDVLIVLLIFLMVTTTFKQQSALRLALPESSQAKKNGAGEIETFEVSIDANGLFYLINDKYPKKPEVILGELLKKTAANKNLVLAIAADEKAPWGKIVDLREIAAKAKIKSLVAYTREKTKP